MRLRCSSIRHSNCFERKYFHQQEKGEEDNLRVRMHDYGIAIVPCAGECDCRLSFLSNSHNSNLREYLLGKEPDKQTESFRPRYIFEKYHNDSEKNISVKVLKKGRSLPFIFQNGTSAM